jgi:hypothetical protein
VRLCTRCCPLLSVTFFQYTSGATRIARAPVSGAHSPRASVACPPAGPRLPAGGRDAASAAPWGRARLKYGPAYRHTGTGPGTPAQRGSLRVSVRACLCVIPSVTKRVARKPIQGEQQTPTHPPPRTPSQPASHPRQHTFTPAPPSQTTQTAAASRGLRSCVPGAPYPWGKPHGSVPTAAPCIPTPYHHRTRHAAPDGWSAQRQRRGGRFSGPRSAALEKRRPRGLPGGTGCWTAPLVQACLQLLEFRITDSGSVSRVPYRVPYAARAPYDCKCRWGAGPRHGLPGGGLGAACAAPLAGAYAGQAAHEAPDGDGNAGPCRRH